MSTYIPFVLSSNAITIFHKGTHIISYNDLRYKEICDAVKGKNPKTLEKLLLKKTTKEGLEVREDEVLYNGEPLNWVATKRLFELKAAGFDHEPLVKYLENCQKNAFPEICEKLYEFLESRGMPLTEDGCFICYKYTKKDYWDSYTGKTYQFTPGSHIIAKDINLRGTFKDLSGEECSKYGIHVGNHDYSGSSETVVFVKVNPANVLSVPYGDNAKKIRVWELDVLERTDGKINEDVLVTSENKKVEYVKGNELHCLYKDGDGKQREYKGTIKDLGKVYLQLDKDTKEFCNGTWACQNGFMTPVPVRLKIANITKVL